MAESRGAEAERTVLGAIIVDNECFYTAADALRPPDFGDLKHQLVFRAMRDLRDAGSSIDLVTLKNKLAGSAADASYIAGLIDGVPRIKDVASWVKIVRSASALRKLDNLANKVKAEVRNGADPEEVMGRLLKACMHIGNESRVVDPSQSVKDAFSWLDAVSQADAGMMGVRTGLRELDQLLLGLKKGTMNLVAARTSQGKTALAIQIGEAVAEDGGVVAMFSLEMSYVQVTVRRLLSVADVGLREIAGRTRTNDAHDAWDRLAAAAGKVRDRPFYIDDTSRLTASQVLGRARKLRAQLGKLDLVIVDYVQIMGVERRSENRQREVSEISEGLLMLAKELEVPVIACAQLNRGAEARRNKKPQLTDLRESGALEQDAHVAMLIWRPGEYGVKTSDGQRVSDTIIVAKHRDGPTGSVGVNFEKRVMTFRDLDVGQDFVEAPPDAEDPIREEANKVFDFKSAASGDRD